MRQCSRETLPSISCNVADDERPTVDRTVDRQSDAALRSEQGHQRRRRLFIISSRWEPWEGSQTLPHDGASAGGPAYAPRGSRLGTPRRVPKPSHDGLRRGTRLRPTRDSRWEPQEVSSALGTPHPTHLPPRCARPRQALPRRTPPGAAQLRPPRSAASRFAGLPAPATAPLCAISALGAGRAAPAATARRLRLVAIEEPAMVASPACLLLTALLAVTAPGQLTRQRPYRRPPAAPGRRRLSSTPPRTACICARAARRSGVSRWPWA